MAYIPKDVHEVETKECREEEKEKRRRRMGQRKSKKIMQEMGRRGRQDA